MYTVSLCFVGYYMKLINEKCLKLATPYMLRNDGELIECSPMHPYFKYIIQDNNKNQIEYLFNRHPEFIDWFYNNTKHKEIKEELNLFISSIINNDNYNINNKNYYIDKYNVNNTNNNTYDIEQLFLELNNELNQEFCRVRTSNMKFGGESKDIYFRISSTNFNWFNIIWNLVYENKKFIETITICTDTQSRGGKPEIYNHNGIKINQLNIDDFLNLSGNPIIENKDNIINNLQKGNSLIESFNSIHPGHINNCFDILVKNYIETNFK